MLVGLMPTNGEPFDPLVHIDLECCTVTIDTWTTNCTMYNYSLTDCDSLRSFIGRVPLSHPFWEVDPSLGDEVWNGAWDQAITPIAPSPDFHIPLVPIDPWLSGTQDAMPFECGECLESFKTAGLLLKHYQQQHGSEGPTNLESQGLDDVTEKYWDTTCKDCGKTFNSRKQFRTHIESGVHTDTPKYKCHKCDKVFDSQKGLKNHMVVHTDDRPFRCSICGAAFKENVTLKRHLGTHDDNRPKYDCPICGKSLGSEKSLKMHQKMVHEGEKHPCEKCDSVLGSRAAYLLHMQRSHGENKGQHQCPKCSKLLSNENSLAVHMRDVHGEKQDYPCSKCGSILRSLASLQTHMRASHGEKKYECPDCGKGFTTKQGLEDHMTDHTGEKPHACDKCDAKYKRRGALHNHKKKHH